VRREGERAINTLVESKPGGGRTKGRHR